MPQAKSDLGGSRLAYLWAEKRRRVCYKFEIDCVRYMYSKRRKK